MCALLTCNHLLNNLDRFIPYWHTRQYSLHGGDHPERRRSCSCKRAKILLPILRKNTRDHGTRAYRSPKWVTWTDLAIGFTDDQVISWSHVIIIKHRPCACLYTDMAHMLVFSQWSIPSGESGTCWYERVNVTLLVLHETCAIMVGGAYRSPNWATWLIRPWFH
jgi:hypothetical protein